jgi:hypothetical protein
MLSFINNLDYNVSSDLMAGNGSTETTSQVIPPYLLPNSGSSVKSLPSDKGELWLKSFIGQSFLSLIASLSFFYGVSQLKKAMEVGQMMWRYEREVRVVVIAKMMVVSQNTVRKV